MVRANRDVLIWVSTMSIELNIFFFNSKSDIYLSDLYTSFKFLKSFDQKISIKV